MENKLAQLSPTGKKEVGPGALSRVEKYRDQDLKSLPCNMSHLQWDSSHSALSHVHPMAGA